MGIGGQIGEFAGGLIGEVDAMDNDAMVQYLMNLMKQRYEELPDAQRVDYTPLGRSELSDVSEDPRYRNAEDEALRRMMETATSGGMTDQDKAKLEQAKLAGLDYERGVRGRDEALMKRRGIGSGALISAQLQAQQGGIDRAYKGDMMTASDAADRALAALEAGGRYANALGSRDLNQKNMTASANDRIAQFNAQRGDAEELYNSSLAHRNALDRAEGLDREAGIEMGFNDMWGQRTRNKWRGYGKQAGSLGDSFSSMSGM